MLQVLEENAVRKILGSSDLRGDERPTFGNLMLLTRMTIQKPKTRPVTTYVVTYLATLQGMTYLKTQAYQNNLNRSRMVTGVQQVFNKFECKGEKTRDCIKTVHSQHQMICDMQTTMAAKLKVLEITDFNGEQYKTLVSYLHNDD